MRAGLRDGPVPVDADGGWLHDIGGERYVMAPACFEAFAAGRDLASATVRNRVVRLPAQPTVAVPSAFVQAGCVHDGEIGALPGGNGEPNRGSSAESMHRTGMMSVGFAVPVARGVDAPPGLKKENTSASQEEQAELVRARDLAQWRR